MGVLGGAFNPVTTVGRQLLLLGADGAGSLRAPHAGAFSTGSISAAKRCRRSRISTPTAISISSSATRSIRRGSDAGRLVVFTNEGTTTAPRVPAGRDTLKLVDAFHLAPAFGDLDADGDPICCSAPGIRTSCSFATQGTAREPRLGRGAAATIQPPRVSSATPALADIDGDKDLDLFVGQATGAIVFYRNDGTAKAPKFTLVSERIDDIRAGRRSAPALVDVDGDGLLDLVVGREARRRWRLSQCRHRRRRRSSSSSTT